ncbi:hypothetical protein GcM3_188016 [Golovinomyces cichoracearum]|uniref:Uncharacterized protein n=1 Tax=Golovinomyces cichoracearum TaxID=62708 RepID=A0A420HIW5_9PEZI|nr:hypothetical protein GcM3_188016 [Golovinomyces cichoracearum]
MFCSSLRGRKDWTEVPATLLAIEFPKWKELTLATCDLAIPFPSPKNSTKSSDLVRFILLSRTELTNTSSVFARIQKFYHAYGGKNIAIMFLLNQHDPKENRSCALMRLQTNQHKNDYNESLTSPSFLSEYEIPVVPLFRVESLEVTLNEFRQQLRMPPLSPRIIVPEVALLPYCSIHPPIPEHARNLLSDICPNIAGLQALVITHEGMQKLANILSDYPPLTQEIVGFWINEYIIE